MQDRPFKQQPQLSTEDYVKTLSEYKIESENLELGKRKIQESKAALAEQNSMPKDVLAKNKIEYKDLKKSHEANELHLIFHSQDAVAKLTGEQTEPQLTTEEYLLKLAQYFELLTNLPIIKNVKKQIENDINDFDDLLILELMIPAYEMLKEERKETSKQLIFNSQKAIVELYGSKSGMFGQKAPRSKENARNTSESSASNEDSSQYRSLSLSSSSSD